MKRSTKIIILSALCATTVLLSGCSNIVDVRKIKEVPTGRTKIFQVGEHTISVPHDVYKDGDIRTEYIEVPNQEGYESIGIANCYGGDWSIMYRNTVIVEVEETTRGYTHFGIPVKEEVVMKLEH